MDRSQIIFGGQSGPSYSYARVATWGVGWIAGSRGVKVFRHGAEGVRQAWEQRDRAGQLRLLAQPYFSLGPQAQANAEAYLTDHYALEGPDASSIAAATLTDAKAIHDAIAAYQQAGCHELILFPCNPDPQQVHLLADAIR